MRQTLLSVFITISCFNIYCNGHRDPSEYEKEMASAVNEFELNAKESQKEQLRTYDLQKIKYGGPEVLQLQEIEKPPLKKRSHIG